MTSTSRIINDTYRIEAGERIWYLRVSPSRWRTVPEVADGGETIIDFDCCGWGYRANDEWLRAWEGVLDDPPDWLAATE